jgi:hypothetical protein
MTISSASDRSSEQTERALVSHLFHAISQPLTALECGLEASLRTDKTAAEFRARVASALAAARLLHQRLLEARAIQDAGEPGDTRLPVAVKALLMELQEDFLPVAESRKVKLDVQCETALVRGNEARFKNGFFHLLEFLLRNCPFHGAVRIRAHRVSPSELEVGFSYDLAPTGSLKLEQAADPADLGFRIAQRTFQAAGGNLVLTQSLPGLITGYLRLILAQ